MTKQGQNTGSMDLREQQQRNRVSGCRRTRLANHKRNPRRSKSTSTRLQFSIPWVLAQVLTDEQQD